MTRGADLPLSHHARFEMRRRGISEEEVRTVHDHPTQRIQLAGTREAWQNKIVFEGREYVLRLIVDIAKDDTIVTVYRTSKIGKYWRKDL